MEKKKCPTRMVNGMRWNHDQAEVQATRDARRHSV